MKSIIRPKALEAALFVASAGLVAISGFKYQYVLIIFCIYVTIVLSVNNTSTFQRLNKLISRMFSDSKSIAIVLLVIVLLYIWGISLWAIVLVVGFISSVLYQWSSKIFAISTALAFLACACLLIINLQTLAQTISVYAYCFLVMTIVIKLIENKRDLINN